MRGSYFLPYRFRVKVKQLEGGKMDFNLQAKARIWP